MIWLTDLLIDKKELENMMVLVFILFFQLFIIIFSIFCWPVTFTLSSWSLFLVHKKWKTTLCILSYILSFRCYELKDCNIFLEIWFHCCQQWHNVRIMIHNKYIWVVAPSHFSLFTQKHFYGYHSNYNMYECHFWLYYLLLYTLFL